MADPLSIGRVNQKKWEKLTPREIIKEQSRGEEIPAELLVWAEQMAAFSKIPDDVTYEQVDGDVGLDALSKLGIEDSNPDNAIESVETEDVDAVKDPDSVEEETPLDNPVEDENPGYIPETPEEDDNETFTLADASITSDDEEIRKRKARKGLQ